MSYSLLIFHYTRPYYVFTQLYYELNSHHNNYSAYYHLLSTLQVCGITATVISYSISEYSHLVDILICVGVTISLILLTTSTLKSV